MPTPHISAQPGDFASTVLFPGDPLRAKFIAEHFLENARQVTDVRNMFGFTGSYQGKSVSVMGSGMGIPSCSIYSRELFTEYGVEKIIRVGSAGAISESVNVRDIVVAMGACTDSKVNRTRFKGHDFAAIADYELLYKAVEAAKQRQISVRVGNVFSSDLFYTPEPEMFDVMEKHGVLAVEMEAAGLYGVAAECGKAALCLVTISDHIRRGEALSAADRQTTFNDMIELTLTSLV
ncbi:purine-nucleoside phosphorylase [Celerinatantimonas sp. YJH-8]|uniref:purine-nucleoside phosphorylase n=1 Tax=Celerinatantimonas sp. YJH-8 TaxID=3228714 RepID=UPI0038CBAEB1